MKGLKTASSASPADKKLQPDDQVETKTKKTMTGAAILWECLEREGVKHVFGYPGGAILPGV